MRKANKAIVRKQMREDLLELVASKGEAAALATLVPTGSKAWGWRDEPEEEVSHSQAESLHEEERQQESRDAAEKQGLSFPPSQD